MIDTISNDVISAMIKLSGMPDDIIAKGIDMFDDLNKRNNFYLTMLVAKHINVFPKTDADMDLLYSKINHYLYAEMLASYFIKAVEEGRIK